MSDFCSVCAPAHGLGRDIDIDEIFESLPLDHYVTCLCEGCGLQGIQKTKDGKLQAWYMGEQGWQDLKERNDE